MDLVSKEAEKEDLKVLVISEKRNPILSFSILTSLLGPGHLLFHFILLTTRQGGSTCAQSYSVSLSTSRCPQKLCEMMRVVRKTSFWAMQLVLTGITISPGKRGRFLVLGEGAWGQG